MRCFQQLRAEYETGARSGPFELVLSMFRMEEMPPYTDIAKDYGMTVPQVKSFLHRARDRFRKILLTEVQVTVSEPGEADSEIEELIRLLK